MPIFSVDLIGLVSQLSLERESASMWELSFVVPPNHGNYDSISYCWIGVDGGSYFDD